MHEAPASLAGLARGLRARLDEFIAELVPGYEKEIPEYANGPVPRDEIVVASRGQVLVFLDALEDARGLTEEERSIGRALGARRAQEGLPLAALVRAFQLGGRVLWQALVREAQSLGTIPSEDLYVAAADVFEFLNEMSNEVSTGYRDWLAEMDAHRERMRTELAATLVRGDPTEFPSAAERARALGLAADGFFLAGVVLMNGRDDDRAEETSLRRFCRERLSAELLAGRLDAGLVVVLPLARAERAAELREWREEGALLCVGDVVSGLRRVPRSHRQALAAARAVSGRTRDGVVAYRDVLTDVIMRADDDAARDLAHAVLTPLLDGSAGSADLLSTLEAVLDCQYSLARAAQRLGIHRNTVAYRMRQIERRIARAPDPLALHLALRWWRTQQHT